MDAMDMRPDVTLAEAVASLDAELGAVAPPPAAPDASAGARVGRFVQFTVAGTCYAVPEAYVTEIGRVPKVTTIPRSPDWLRGVANLRGDLLSIVDVRVFLGLDPVPLQSGRLLVVRLLDEEINVGLMVDTIDQILTLEIERIQPPASPLEGPLAPYLSGMCLAGERLVAVLNLERLLRSADIRQFDAAKEDSSCLAG